MKRKHAIYSLLCLFICSCGFKSGQNNIPWEFNEASLDSLESHYPGIRFYLCGEIPLKINYYESMKLWSYGEQAICQDQKNIDIYRFIHWDMHSGETVVRLEKRKDLNFATIKKYRLIEENNKQEFTREISVDSMVIEKEYLDNISELVGQLKFIELEKHGDCLDGVVWSIEVVRSGTYVYQKIRCKSDSSLIELGSLLSNKFDLKFVDR
jgi:hypothetical protein